MTYRLLHNPFAAPLAVGVVALVAVAALTGDQRWLAAVGLMATYALCTVGLNFAQGASGMFTMGHAAFMGVGAYATAYLTTAREMAPLTAMAVGAAISAAVGALFALLTLRVSEIYLAIATLALVQIFGGLLLAYPGITNGVDGIAAIPSFGVGGFEADTVAKNTIVNILVLVALAVVASAILRGKRGREFRAIREDHLAALGSGVKVNGALNLAFVLQAVFASVAGSLFAHTLAFIDPTAFALDLAVVTIAMLVIGGSGSVIGAIVGAALLQTANEYLTEYHAYSQLMFGLVIVFGALVSPVGIVGGLRPLAGRVPALKHLVEPIPPRTPAPREPRPVDPSANGHAPAGSLAATGVVKSFGGVRALRGVDLTIEAGQIHALIGPNGSGKSTFINVLSGVYTADSGAITLDGRRIDRLGPAQRATSGTARTYQNGRLFADLPVYENVQVTADHRSRTPGALGRAFPDVRGKAWVELVVDVVGIGPFEAVPAKSLGFGNQRRAELARALALDPRFLLLDEPAAGLTAIEQDALVDLLRRLAGLGMGILLVEHSMNVVMGVADRVTVLDFGAVIGHGAPADVREDKAVIDAYLGV
ncbi:branched-chain amino acid ABC transporter ATP-binding protein/permease [Phytohabitans sp. ZYX-F-186]|uniref:Branched-chain amino acid ABC transporter ATP-binding protein/permease n=1 Tax=Phytohabitans maris TaxID=3071409 RepID=A0ABU0ZUU9_9ACTN|nr:branched-chain amino acid ABC transporter ATP-binding protein/permease [Phytohabitans sp. ZYX-F-186]MDQ7910815.1 branched-chain amino acid ABC transporter ATP-binding protein/permease [Phytohabitans sp. ZYX-F-186]